MDTCLYRLLEVVAIKGRSRLDKLSYSKTRIHLQVNITEAYNVLYTKVMAVRYSISRLYSEELHKSKALKDMI